MNSNQFQHVSYLWDDEHAAQLDAVGLLIYRSNLLGQDGLITNTGGGNTSAKIEETDPLTGEKTVVMWVKGSGGDLRTSKRENFSSLYQDKLIGLQKLYAGKPNRGPKSMAEDEMVALYSQTTFNLNPRTCSIDTPLHAFVPCAHVDHTHPIAVIAVAASENGEALTREIYGDDLVWTPWQRPGFELGLTLRDIARAHPNAKGVLLGGHGLISWANNGKECYELSLELIERAARFVESRDKGDATFGGQKFGTLDEAKQRETLCALLPWLRGQVSQHQRFVGTVQSDEKTLRFINSHDAARLAELGTSCPDHFLRTKIKPLYVEWNPQTEDLDTLKTRLSAGLTNYRDDYKSYYESCKRADSPAMRDPNPTVVLIPGLGMIAWGRDKSESRVTAEFYGCAIEVMRGAQAISTYTALPQQEAFDIEYWLLEEAKLKRMPPEKSLARQVVMVIGAGSGIGKEVAHRIAPEGAHIVSVDLNESAARQTADELSAKLGMGVGIAGTGISGCGPAIGVAANITDRASIKAALDQAILAFGGVDAIAVTAGIFVAPDTSGHIPDDKWGLTFSINVTGSYLVADEAFARVLKEQGLRSRIVLTTSANAVVAKKGSLAYDTSKAAANHLVRELAIELSPLVRVNGVAPATVVKGSTMFPRDRVVSSLAKYDIDYSELESDDELRDKLAHFYAGRTLTKAPIEPNDQAEAFYVLLTEQLSKTTGQIISVDGGLHEAFLR